MPYPSETYVNQIADAAARAEWQQFYSLLQGWLSVQHKESGAHSAVTADSLVTTGNVSADTDVVAQLGTGQECGLGALNTVNGTALVPGEVIRQGMLVGGAANGFWFEWRAKQSPFTTGYELAIWSLGFGTSKPVLRLGNISGTMTLLDGGSGASINIGSSGSSDSPFVFAQTLECSSTFTAQANIVLSTSIAPAQITADQNNYNPTGFLACATVILDSDAARSITGFAAGTTGQRIRLINNGSFTITLTYNSGSSSVGNKMIAPGRVNFGLVQGGSVVLEYRLGFWFVCEN